MVKVMASVHDRTCVPNCWYAGLYRQADGTAPAKSAIVQKDLFRSTFTSVAVRALLNALLVSTLSASAANWYVRPGGAGSTNGTDWNNAWDSGGIAWASLSGGDTIWMAGGTYTSQLRPAKSGSPSAYIYIKRVLSTDAIPTATAGWNSAYDEQVVVNTPTVSCITFGNSGSYTYWDGRVDSGIRLQSGESDSYQNSASAYLAADQSYVVFTNIDMAGPWGASPVTPNVQVNNLVLDGVSYITVANCRLHGGANMAYLNYSDYVTFDHCKFYDGVHTSASAHCNVLMLMGVKELTVKYCEWWNWMIEGFAMWANCGTIRVYGCVFRDPFRNEHTYAARVFEPDSYPNASGGVCGPIYVYNNTFVNCDKFHVWTYSRGAVYASGSIVRNNIVWNCMSWDAPDSDYNYSDSNLGEAHSINGVGQVPFVDVSAKDFHIVSGISGLLPRNKGISIPSDTGHTYGLDRDGKSRGSDGAWDIGAYEYGSISTNPVISVTPMSLTFGAVAETKVVTNFITVQNVGGGKLAGTATLGSTNSDFSIVSGHTYSLDANQSAQVGIRYAPTKATDSATVMFSGGGQATASVNGQMQVAMSELSFPASSGVITAPFTKDISGYVSQSVQTGLAGGGRAVYAFRITDPGNYTVSAAVNAPDMSANSFYVNIDADPTDPTMIWDVPVTAGFVNQTVSWRGNGTDTANQHVPAVFKLSADVHQLVIVGREAGVQLGPIIIAPDNGASLSPPPPPEKLRFVSVGF